MVRNRFSLCLTLILGGFLILPMPADAAPVLFSDSGANAAAIQDGVDAFRAALGNPNNANAPGPLATGRREINWDGGGGVDANAVAGTPFNGFLNTRGAQFTTPGTGFVQAPPAGGPNGGLATQFGNPTYATTFATFSPLRLFTPIGSNITDVFFFIPGTNGAQLAAVSAFGAVFSDVDLGNTTSIEYFGLSGASLGAFPVSNVNSADPSFSFLGVQFTGVGELISRVRITTGNAILGPTATDRIFDTANVDVVVMDDFLYAEPRAVPEPYTLLLLGVAIAGLWLRKRSQ